MHTSPITEYELKRTSIPFSLGLVMIFGQMVSQPHDHYFSDTYISPKNIHELIEVMLQFEKQVRVMYRWMGGVDRHHVFFRGLVKKGIRFEIQWDN